MRALFLLGMLGLGGAALAAAPAHAGGAPSFVVPGRADVPVVINGVDASWCVVDGAFGLERPGAVVPTVTCSIPVSPDRGAEAPVYFPYTGERPRVGRLEVHPPANRRLPPPAERFSRVWSAGSDPEPVTNYPAYQQPSDGGGQNMPMGVHRRHLHHPHPYLPNHNR